MTVDLLVLGLAVVALAAAFALLVQERRQQQRMDEAAERLGALLDRIEASGKVSVTNHLASGGAARKPEIPPNRLVRMGLHGGDVG